MGEVPQREVKPDEKVKAASAAVSQGPAWLL